MTANLISVSQAMDNGVDKMVFTKDKVKIIKNQSMIAKGTRRGKLYSLDYKDKDQCYLNHKTPPTATYEIWHERLGHLNYPDIKRLCKFRYNPRYRSCTRRGLFGMFASNNVKTANRN